MVSSNPFDFTALWQLIPVVNIHFLSRFKEVDSGTGVIHVEVFVVVFQRNSEVNLGNIRTNRGHITFQTGSHHRVVVVNKAITKSDRVNPQPAFRVLHLVENQSQLRSVLKHFLSGKFLPVIISELNFLSLVTYNVKVHRIVLTKVDSDTTKVSRKDVQIDGQGKLTIRNQVVADKSRIVVTSCGSTSGKKEHRPVNLREVFFKGCIDGIICFLPKDIVGVTVSGEVTLFDTGFCLRFLIDQTER